MIVEGRGDTIPAKCRRQVCRGSFHHAIAEATRRDEKRNYGQRNDQWGRGLIGKAIVIQGIGTVRENIAPIVTGMIGEFVTADLINNRMGKEACKVDLTLQNYGDGGIDLSPCGLNIDVKTRRLDKGKHLVRRRRANGSLVEWRCDAFVFCEWTGNLYVDVCGWMWSKDLESRPLVHGIGGHLNVAIGNEELLPVSRLIAELRSR